MKPSVDTTPIFANAIADHLKIVSSLTAERPKLESIARKMSETIREGKKILWCGNGGSAADSQHLAAELVGRFRRERQGLPSIALTTDTSILTSIGNDYGFAEIFRRQVEALATTGDLLVGLSTSGNSSNVCAAIEKGRELGVYTVAMTGAGGGRAAELADCCLCIPSTDTARIQEAHILVGHIFCDWIEADAGQASRTPQGQAQ